MQAGECSKAWDQSTGASAQATAETVFSSRLTLAQEGFAASSIPVKAELVRLDGHSNENTLSEAETYALESLIELLLKI